MAASLPRSRMSPPSAKGPGVVAADWCAVSSNTAIASKQIRTLLEYHIANLTAASSARAPTRGRVHPLSIKFFVVLPAAGVAGACFSGWAMMETGATLWVDGAAHGHGRASAAGARPGEAPAGTELRRRRCSDGRHGRRCSSWAASGPPCAPSSPHCILICLTVSR
jgi:hypothetical protein